MKRFFIIVCALAVLLPARVSAQSGAVSAAVASGHYCDFDEAIAAMVAMDTACEPQDAKRADDWFARYKERRQSLLV